MRALLPEPADDVDIREFYARGWLDRGGIRMNFVASVDGAATAEGRSKGLQTPGDNRVFTALRDLADIVLAGAGTVRIEGYEAIGMSATRAERRARFGLPPLLPTAVVSRSLRLDPDSPLFTAAPPDARTVVITTAAADPGTRRALAQVADVAVCGETSVDFVAARAALHERGYVRVLSEGGPTLFGEMANAGVVDELCLSVTPLLAGPGARRVVAGELWQQARRLTLLGLLEEDGALFCRYGVGEAFDPTA